MLSSNTHFTNSKLLNTPLFYVEYIKRYKYTVFYYPVQKCRAPGNYFVGSKFQQMLSVEVNTGSFAYSPPHIPIGKIMIILIIYATWYITFFIGCPLIVYKLESSSWLQTQKEVKLFTLTIMCWFQMLCEIKVGESKVFQNV